MIKVLFALAVAGFVFLVLFGVIKSKIVPQQEINERLKSIEEDVARASARRRMKKTEEGVAPFRERVIMPLENSIGRAITNMAPAEWSRKLEKKLASAGKAKVWSVQLYAIFWVVALLAGLFFSIRYVSHAQHLAAVQSMMVILLGAAMGGTIPWMVLRILAQKRQKMIQKQLPEVLDLLCVSVQAGLSFDAALRRIVERMEGPLIEEADHMLDDIRMGLPRRQALKLMGERCEVQDVNLFVTAIIQAERLGTSIGKTLSNQAVNMRERRRQLIKAEAMKAPVKMIFPLVLFIFPAIFVVVLMPSLLSMMKNFLK